jgi:imidazole glycerol-phosphate synthase subunit HisH
LLTLYAGIRERGSLKATDCYYVLHSDLTLPFIIMSCTSVGIINSGSGNLGSLTSILSSLSLSTYSVGSYQSYDSATEYLVLPGVGSFNHSICSITDRKLDKVIYKHLENGKKLLAICIGFQLLFDYGSEGGGSKGLGLIPGRCDHLTSITSPTATVPHMGFTETALPLRIANSRLPPYFYYMHSYGVALPSNADPAIFGSFSYHSAPLISSLSIEGITGFQFHPEKSQQVGHKLLQSVFSHDS